MSITNTEFPDTRNAIRLKLKCEILQLKRISAVAGVQQKPGKYLLN